MATDCKSRVVLEYRPYIRLLNTSVHLLIVREQDHVQCYKYLVCVQNVGGGGISSDPMLLTSLEGGGVKC